MPDRYIGELRVMERLNNYEFAFEADILRTGPVQGGRWEFGELEKNYLTFAGKPVLIAYVNGKVGDGHNAAERTDFSTGERYRSFTDATAERIIGLISEDERDLTLYERDGYKWLRVNGRIWSYYAKEAVDEIVRTGRMDVSIEAEVKDMREESGREIYDSWVGIGLTILGAGVDPAVPGANIRALADMQQEFENMKLRVASLVEEGKKPQKNTFKGVKHSMRLSKQQLRELQEKFGDYTVLAAEQTESGVVVCLMSKSGDTAIYKMASVDESVVLDRVQTVNAQTHFCADGCEDILVDACDLVETFSAAATEACDNLAAAQRELAEAKNTIGSMREAEDRRRVQAAKDKATATLAAFNLNREAKVDEKVLSAVTADIDAGAYTARVDADGNWTGDRDVEEKVLSLCASAVMEMDEAAAKANKSAFVWERLASGAADDGSIEALLARKGIQG